MTEKTMIFLAITLDGVKKAIQMKIKNKDIHEVWCGSDAISEKDDLYKYVSRFDYPLNGVENHIINEALETIEEHHPNAIVWIEHIQKK